MKPKPGMWIGVDLDGTLAHFAIEADPRAIGAPIMPMVRFVQAMLADGVDVRIFTARVDGGKAAIAMGDEAGYAYVDTPSVVRDIEAWCAQHIGQVLPVTNQKDYAMVALYDDRAMHVERNTGRILTPSGWLP